MTHFPHPQNDFQPLLCAVLTISDTRTMDNDRSGQTMQSLLQAAGYPIQTYQILKDEPQQIKTVVHHLITASEVRVILLNGGTGIAPRDTTYDVIAQLLEKELSGFGELFRWLSYQEIGSRAMASRAIGGTCHTTLIFALPGSTAAVKLGLEQLILPELQHLAQLLQTEPAGH